MEYVHYVSGYKTVRLLRPQSLQSLIKNRRMGMMLILLCAPSVNFLKHLVYLHEAFKSLGVFFFILCIKSNYV